MSLVRPDVIAAGTTIEGLHFIQDWPIEVNPSTRRGYLVVTDKHTLQVGMGILLKDAIAEYVTSLRHYVVQNWSELPPWMRIGFRVVPK